MEIVVPHRNSLERKKEILLQILTLARNQSGVIRKVDHDNWPLISPGGDNMTANHKIDRHTKKGPRAQRAHKEEATFDAELQRYFMPNERRISMIKQDKGG